MEIKEPKFAFQKRLGIAECLYGDIGSILSLVGKLLQCMKETNTYHNEDCEFFRLDFRPSTYDEELLREFPYGSLVLDLKWGSKKEVKEELEKEERNGN